MTRYSTTVKLTTILLGVVLGLVLCELVLAFFLPPPLYYYYPQPLHIPDQAVGWVLKPNQHSYTIDKPVTINSEGFRSRATTYQRDPASVRILCLGDSQTFGNGVAQDETYPARLESQLSSRAFGRPVEVINAGIQGYDIGQEVTLLENLAPSVKPNVVTIGFYLNDIVDIGGPKNGKIIDEEFKREGAIKQYLPYRFIYALKRSRLVTLIYWRYMILQADAEGDPTKEILLGRTPARFQKSWQLIEEALQRARRLAAARQFQLIVFPVPAGQEFFGDYPNEEYRSRFLALARKLGIDSIDPTTQMKSAGGGFERYFITWDGHINSLTHNLISELLFAKIEALWPPQTMNAGAKAGHDESDGFATTNRSHALSQNK